MSIFDGSYFEVFAGKRQVPGPVMNYYLWLLLGNGRHRMLDVGAGTGQFAQAAKEVWGAEVSLLEPSPSAADGLRDQFPSSAVYEEEFATFESDGGFTAVLLSEVVHLLRMEPGEILEKLRSLLGKGGRALIRTSSEVQLNERKWYSHFPAALKLDLQRHIDLEEMVKLCSLSKVDFRQVVVDESRWVPAAEYLSWFYAKAYSTLRMISEEDYARGLVSLLASTNPQCDVWYDYQMTGLVIQM